MDMRKLLEAVIKFAGEPEQKAGEQWKGTDKGTPGKKLVGDSIIKDLAKGTTPKTKEEELAEAYANFMEDDIGVEPKRPARKGDRPGREYTKHGKPSKRYTPVKEGFGTGNDRVSLPDRPNTYYSGTGPLQKEYDALYAELVPSQGKADTVEGEVLRASSKIIYRHYNDGDEFNQASFDQLKPYIGHVTSYDDLAHKAIMFAAAAEGEYHPNPSWDSLDVMEYGPEEYDDDDDEDEYYGPRDDEDADEDLTEEYDQDDDQGFFVALGSEDEGGFVGIVTKDGGKWREGRISGKAPYNWGGSYMGYLTSDDVMRMIRNDYGNYDVKGPFSSGEEAKEYAEMQYGLDEGWAQDSADAQRNLSAAATDRVLQKYQDNPELSAIAKFMSRNNWTAQSIDDTMQGRGKFDIDWWKNTMSKNLPETKHKRKDTAVYEGIESADPVEGAVLSAVQELIQQGHTEVAPEVITNMVVAATSQPFLLKDLVDVNNKSAAVQHYVNSINPTKVKFSNEILTVKNEDPLKDKKSAQAGVSNMAARAAGRNRLGEASTPLRDREDYQAKSKALQDIQMDSNTHNDPQLKAELVHRLSSLNQQYAKLQTKLREFKESRGHKVIKNKLQDIESQKAPSDVNSLDQRAERAKAEYCKYVAKMKKVNPDYIPLYKMDEAGSAIGGSAMTVSSSGDSGLAAIANPENAKKAMAATAQLKSATGSQAAPDKLMKALDAASQGEAVGAQDMAALEPMMDVVASAATDPKLANQFKSLANQAKQSQQQAK